MRVSPYLGRHMKKLFSSIAPIAGTNEVFVYMRKKRPHRWGFMGVSAAITGFFVWALIHDSRAEIPYKRDIIYVESWSLNRTDAEIVAQQKIDQAAKEKREAELAAKKEKVRREYQKVDDALKRWGL